MTLAEIYASYDPPIEIIASDIDSKVLSEASAGIYNLQRLDSVSLDQRKQFFQRGTGTNAGKARVVPELRNLIDFRKINLLHSSWDLPPSFDIIFCRNVMIYFDKPTQLKLLARMVKLLRPDGLYISGHSESFSQAGNLVRLVDKTTYRPANPSDVA
jgi:chemotaxis protein methyltransferase CheR